MSIQVSGLSHIYSKGLPYQSVALDSVSFEVAGGEFFGIIGHTGSGKSTLVQHLNGLLKPDSGSIVIDGVDITKGKVPMHGIRRKVGLVFQYPEHQLFEESVYKDVAFGPLNLGLSADEAERCVREAIALVGLDFEEVSQRSPFELSGGQKRRIAIAGVLSMKPEILILDEPTAGLDPKTHNDVLLMIRRIHETTGNITILVSHNMSDIANCCEKILVLKKGGVLMQGAPAEVFVRKDELAASGLDVPPVMDFMQKLSAGGLDVKTDIFSVDDAVDEIVRALNDGKKETIANMNICVRNHPC
ncbi:MAG: energy-coupling factor transporter ATPase [Clostridiales bacterium]|nr:energy-coupling factor transporter ATPase [Clostridiales bacterium]